MIIKQSDKELCKCAAKDKQSLLGCKSFNLVPRFSTSSRYVGLRLRIPLLCTYKLSLYRTTQATQFWQFVSMSFAKSWQEKGCSSQAETWQVKNILMKDFDWQVKFDVFVVSMATWTIEYNLKISLLLSLHKVRSLDFPINLHTAYYN